MTGTQGPPEGFDHLEWRIRAALESRPTTLVLDLSALEGSLSSTITTLLWAKRHCSARGVEIVLQDPSPRCRAALQRTGLLDVMAVADREPSSGIRDLLTLSRT